VQADVLARNAGRQRNGQFPAAGHVNAQTSGYHPARHLGRQEGFAGVVNRNVGADGRESLGKDRANARRTIARRRLVKHIERGAKIAHEVGHADATHTEHSRFVARGRHRPQSRRKVVGIAGRV
jgi:hypothetical protein